MRHSSEIKNEVLELVRSGSSYGQIQKKLVVPKSTIATWVKNEGIVPDRTRQLVHLSQARLKSTETIHAKKQARLLVAENGARGVLADVPFENNAVQKSLLAMLYWAEGSKGENASLTFVNTDPLLMQLYIFLLRTCYTIEESRIRVRLHLGYWHDHAVAIKFWSELLNVPESQFGKIYVKKRSTQKKFRKNYRGICFVIYGSEAIRQEVLILGRLLAQEASLL